MKNLKIYEIIPSLENIIICFHNISFILRVETRVHFELEDHRDKGSKNVDLKNITVLKRFSNVEIKFLIPTGYNKFMNYSIARLKKIFNIILYSVHL